MQLFIKALIGAAVVVLIQLLTRSKNYYIAGLVPLFPTFALISHYMVGSQRTMPALKNTIIFSMFSLIPFYHFVGFILIGRSFALGIRAGGSRALLGICSRSVDLFWESVFLRMRRL